jgi:hypothetical protein
LLQQEKEAIYKELDAWRGKILDKSEENAEILMKKAVGKIFDVGVNPKF